MTIRTGLEKRFQALNRTSMVACAFNPTTGKIHWQSRPGKEQFGDVVGRDVRDIWPDPQMVAGPVDRIGPTPAGMVRAIGWNLRLDRHAMLSVLERVEVAGAPRGVRGWYAPVAVLGLKDGESGASTLVGGVEMGATMERQAGKRRVGRQSREAARVDAMRKLMQLQFKPQPRKLSARDRSLAAMLSLGYGDSRICATLGIGPAEYAWALIRLARLD